MGPNIRVLRITIGPLKTQEIIFDNVGRPVPMSRYCDFCLFGGKIIQEKIEKC